MATLRNLTEQERLEQEAHDALSGAIKVLTDVICLIRPVAFGRALRVRQLVRQLAPSLAAETSWQVEVAALLSQIGCICIPEETLARAYTGKRLSSTEAQQFESHPQVGRDLIARVPRLDEVATIVACQNKHFDGGGTPLDDVHGAAIPLGARILKVALDFDTLVEGGLECKTHSSSSPSAAAGTITRC